MKTKQEVQDMCDKAASAAENPSFFGLSYEDGVRAALDWVLGNMDDDNLDPLS